MDFRLGYKIELNDGVTRRLGMINKMLALLPPGFRQAAAASIAAGKVMGRAMAGVKNFAFSLKGLALGVGSSLVLKGLIEQSAQVQDQVTGFATLLSLNDLVVDSQGRQIKGAQKLVQAYKLADQVRRQTQDVADKTALTDQEALMSVQQVLGLSRNLGKSSMAEKIDVGTRVAELAKLMIPGVNATGITSETRALLTGENLRTSQVASGLGIQGKEGEKALKQAIKEGKIIQFLLDRTKDLASFRQRASENFHIQASTFESTIGRLQARAGEILTRNLTTALAKLNDVLATPAAAQMARAIGAELGTAANKAIAVAQRLIQLWPQVSATLRPYVDGLIEAGRWALDLGMTIFSIVWPSMQRLTTSLIGADGAGAKLWPTIQWAAETVLPLAAAGIAWVADGLATVIDFANQHPTLVKFGIAMAVAFQVTPGMIGLLGFLASPTGLVQTMGQLIWMVKALPGFLATLAPAFLATAAPIAAVTLAVWGLIEAYQFLRGVQDQIDAADEKIAGEKAASADNAKANMLLRAKAQGKTLAPHQEAFLAKVQQGRSVQKVAAAGVGKQAAQVTAPITTGEIKLAGVVDKDKLMAEVIKAQKTQLEAFQRDLERQLKNGGRPSALAPGVSG
jgi:hypothetical protein